MRDVLVEDVGERDLLRPDDATVGAEPSEEAGAGERVPLGNGGRAQTTVDRITDVEDAGGTVAKRARFRVDRAKGWCQGGLLKVVLSRRRPSLVSSRPQ